MFFFGFFILLLPVFLVLVAWVALVWAFRKKPRVWVSLAALPVIVLGGISLLIALNYSKFEPLVNLVYPPDDLYTPLASVPLSETSTVYSLEFQNKYFGNHRIAIEVPFDRTIEEALEKVRLEVQYKVFDKSQRLLYEQADTTGSPYWGRDRQGFSYCHYKVPEDLPRSIPLRMEIALTGDVASFLQENKGARLLITKASDL